MLFTVGPRFIGVDHGSTVVARVETHKSWPPTPPNRRAGVAIRPVQLRNVHARPPRLVVAAAGADVDVEVPEAPGSIEAREIQGLDARSLVLEERGSGFVI